MPKSFREIKNTSDEQLIKEYDEIAKTTVFGTFFYLDEIRARENSKVSASVEKFTKWVFWLTFVVTASTVINLALYVSRG
jgi:hypothetical protein